LSGLLVTAHIAMSTTTLAIIQVSSMLEVAFFNRTGVHRLVPLQVSRSKRTYEKENELRVIR
jgi:hypothetical protein